MCLLCRAVPLFRTALVRTPHAWIRRAFSCLYVCAPLGAGGVYYVDAAKRGPYSIQFLKYTQSFENSLNGVCLLVLRAFLPRPPSMHCAFFATRPVMNTVAKCMLRPVLVWSSLSIYSSLELYIIHCPLQLYFLYVRKGFVKDACHTINLYAVSISRMCCPCRPFRALFIQRKSAQSSKFHRGNTLFFGG